MSLYAPTCIRIPPYSSRTAPIHQYTPKQSSTLTYSHQLLRMNVIALETCWAIKNFHKVTSSWFNLFNWYMLVGHNGLWWSGCIAPRFLKFGTIRRWVLIFTLQPLFPEKGTTGTHCIRDQVGPRAGLGLLKKRKIICHFQELNHEESVVQPIA